MPNTVLINEWLWVLTLALMPVAGNFTGGLLAEYFTISPRTLSLALHLAAGIVLAVVSVELIPEALANGPAWMMVLAFAGGGVFFIVIDSVINIAAKRTGRDEADAGPWAIFFGVAVDLFSDGVMIGAGSTVTFSLGLLLAMGQVPADVPEGFATIASFRRRGVPRRARLLLCAAFAIPILFGATIGFWVVRGQSDEVKFALLAFTAGVLLTVTVEEILPEAHETSAESRWATSCLIVGFSIFTLLTSYLGS
jgi:ZIP family zinc transporter